MVRPFWTVNVAFVRAWWGLFRSFVSHYKWALWGIGQALDPDCPQTKVTASGDSVFEWRTYGLLPLWAILTAWGLPAAVIWSLALLWAFLAFRRARFYRSVIEFWRQAYWESPFKVRTVHFYAMELMGEAERKMKAGEPYEADQAEAMRLIDRVCELQ